MVKEKILIIEGARDNRNGILRQGFNKLLAQKLEGNMPRIIMGDGKMQAIDKFINYKNSRKPYLLIDLDEKESKKRDNIEKIGLSIRSEDVYFMIQEMEAWFLSQPSILDKYYCSKISSKIPKKHAKEIDNPSGFLNDIVYLRKGIKYHKVVHAVELLKLFDATKLMEDFEEFKLLVLGLKN